MWFFRRRKRNFIPKRDKPEKKRKASVATNIQPSSFQKWKERVNWPIFRINLVICLFCLLWGGLWVRAWHLQMIEGPRLADKARKQHTASELITGKRGLIFDRNGHILARSVEVRSVYARPQEIVDLPGTSSRLAAILNMPAAKLESELAGAKRKFVWLRRKIDDGAAEAIRRAALPGIGLSREYERYYPFKHMAGQLLGFVGMDDKGLEGLERSLDSRLGAMPIRQIVQRDAMGRKFYLHEEGISQPVGEDITLTLDMQVQFMAEEAVAQVAREFDARWSGALVVDLASGDILAWAQYPFFNPNAYRAASPSLYRNRLAADALEPGSTFKPLVMAIALQEKKVTPNTLINCEGGKWETRNFTLRDTSSQGILPASKVLRYSSNIGMAKIGLSLGAPRMYRYLRSLGFGESSQVPVANSRGILRQPRDWGELDIMSTAFGQSVSVTGLQMAQAYLTMLNNGVYKPLRLVREDSAVEEEPQRVLGAKAVAEALDMMRDVVEQPDGTGRRARIAGIEVGGKTGTAQKADARTGAYGSEHLASFVGFFPVQNPRYFILVLVDEPAKNQFGGVVAAPAFKQIAQRLLTYTGLLNETKTAVKAPQPAMYKRGLRLASAPEQPWQIHVAAPAAPSGMRFPGHLARASGAVPDVLGKSVRNAVELFARAGVVPEIKGSGNRVIRQTPPAGTSWPKSDKNASFILWLSEG